MASWITPNVLCSAVIWYSLLSTIWPTASRLSSITMRMPSRSLSSRRSLMPSMRFSLTSSTIFLSSSALLTWYGSSVMTICSRSFLPAIGSMVARARIRMRPRPVSMRLADAAGAVDEAGRGEVGPLDAEPARCVGSSSISSAHGQRGVVDQPQRGVDDLAQVVRRDVGGHADRDAARAVDQQVREARGQDQRLALAVVEVGAEVDRVLVDVGEQLARQPVHAHLGVTHGRRRVAVDRAEVALAVDQRVAHGKVLRHAHQRVVDRLVAVRMVLAEHVADDARRLLVGLVPEDLLLLHRVQDAPVHRLEAVADVGDGATDDDAHRVVEVGRTQLVFDCDRDLLRFRHGLVPTLSASRSTPCGIDPSGAPPRSGPPRAYARVDSARVKKQL